MSNDLIQKNAELGRFLFCERYTLQPVKNALYIAKGQDLKRGAVVDVNGVLVGTNSLMPYAVLENDCDTRAKGAFASVFVKGEFNFDKLFFADGLSKKDLDNIVYNGSGIGLVIKPYDYEKGFSPLFSPSMFPAGTSQSNPLMNAEETERMILKMQSIADKTLRFEFSKKDYNPETAGIGADGTWTKVNSPTLNVWDWTKNDTDWSYCFSDAFRDEDNLVSLIAAGDTSSITNMYGFLQYSSSLISVALFNTSSVTNMQQMFSNCTSLTSVPLLDTSAAKDISEMFEECEAVEGGALALYQQASAQSPQPEHYNTFTNCGKNTATGAAELAQIPESWGGTGA